MAHAGAGNGAENPVDGGEVAGDELLIDGVCVPFLARGRIRHGALGQRRQVQAAVNRRELAASPFRRHQQLSTVC